VNIDLENFIKEYHNKTICLTDTEKKNIIGQLQKDNLKDWIIYYILTGDNITFIKAYFYLSSTTIEDNLPYIKQLFPTTKEYALFFGDIFDNKFYTFDTKSKKMFIYKYWHIYREGFDKEYIYFYKVLKKVFYKEIENNNSEILFYLYLPLIFSHNAILNNQKAFKKFNKQIEKKLAKHIKNYMVPEYHIEKFKPKENKNKKIKVAFVIDRAILHSVNNVLKNLLLALKKSKNKKYKFIILSIDHYDLDPSRPEVEQLFKLIGFDYYNLHRILKCDNSPFYNQVEKAIKIREFIIKKNIDTIIFNGSAHATYNFLATTRVAKNQVYWSHGNCEYNIKGIDKRISHFTQECKQYHWDIFNLPIDRKAYLGTTEDKKQAKLIKQEYLKFFGKDTIILGTIGRLMKIDSKRYIKTVAKIMKKNPNTIYLACGSGDQENIKKLLKKYNIDKDRFLFLGHINSAVYGWVIDYMLDSFPIGQGESKNEFIAKGKIAIFLKTAISKTVENWYKNNTPFNPIANNIKEYIKIANLIVSQKTTQKYLKKYNKTIFKKRFKGFLYE